jgi:hypothetical protein
MTARIDLGFYAELNCPAILAFDTGTDSPTLSTSRMTSFHPTSNVNIWLNNRGDEEPMRKISRYARQEFHLMTESSA